MKTPAATTTEQSMKVESARCAFDSLIQTRRPSPLCRRNDDDRGIIYYHRHFRFRRRLPRTHDATDTDRVNYIMLYQHQIRPPLLESSQSADNDVDPGIKLCRRPITKHTKELHRRRRPTLHLQLQLQSRWTCPFFAKIKRFAMSVICMACLVARTVAFNLPATNFYSHSHSNSIDGSAPIPPRRGTIQQSTTSLRHHYHHSLPLYSTAPAKEADSYDFDAMQEEIMREQSSHPNNKSLRTGATKKGRKEKRRRRRRNIIIGPSESTSLPAEPTAKKLSIRKERRRRRRNDNNVGPTALPTEPNAKKISNMKKQRRSGLTTKTLGSGGAAHSRMPPWLAQYENDDTDAGAYYLAEEPSSSSFARSKSENNQQKALSEMKRLLLALNGIFYRSPSSSNNNDDGGGHGTMDNARTTSNAPEAMPYFAPPEIHEVMGSIRVASRSDSKLMAGCADFLHLMLTLEEEGALLLSSSDSDFSSKEPWDDDDGIGDRNDDALRDRNDAGRRNDGPEPHSIMTRDVLVAAAFHYCDCVRARKAGVYDYARQAMEASLDMRMWKELEEKKLWLPPAEESTWDDETRRTLKSGGEGNGSEKDGREMPSSVLAENESIAASASSVIVRRGHSPIDDYGEESLKIAAGAARLKRAEIMSTIVKSGGSQGFTSSIRSQPNGDSEILRSFLVSLSEDWRALVIRSSACLYRLKGIVEEQEDASSTNGDGAINNGDGNNKMQSPGRSVMLSTTTINTARDAFRVYAPLAQRLGMQRLKSELENTAFRILYPRQFSVASSLYNGDVDEMKSIVRILSSRIEQLLRSDPVFIDQIDHVAVSSRVKEPYSLWKKLLRYRKEAANAENMDNHQFAPATLSLKWVPDAIAFRVVLCALRLSPLEDDESLRTREKMLCYYALQLISDVWPSSTRNEAKDYIKNPKPNGYQSLHYTASLTVSGEDWPFEVQIRSEEMHRIAEFGVAAHWDYKHQNKVTKSLPENALSQGDTTIPALPAAVNSTVVLAETQQSSAETNVTKKTVQKGRVASYIEALTISRETIKRKYRFIFLSSTKSALGGKIVSIDPSASNIADVLGNLGVIIDKGNLDDLEIYQNGVSASLDEELSNGDILTLPSFIIDKVKV